MLNDIVEQLPKWLADTPMGRSLIGAKHQADHAARQAIVDRRAARLAELPPLIDKHDRIVEPLRAATLAAKARLDAATAKQAVAERTRISEMHAKQLLISADERQLIRGASPLIDQAVAEIGARIERDRRTMIVFHESQRPGYTSNSGKPIVTTSSNEPAIRTLLAAIRDARLALDRLKLENPEDLEAAIAEILQPVEQCWNMVSKMSPADAGPRAA